MISLYTLINKQAAIFIIDNIEYSRINNADILTGTVFDIICAGLLNFKDLFHHKTLISKDPLTNSFNKVDPFFDNTLSALPQPPISYFIKTAQSFSSIVSLMQPFIYKFLIISDKFIIPFVAFVFIDFD